ncbi:Uncharacterised protein [Agrobacterium tumefaciens]|nr:Uncharacterised protein [Agrobacterium tumefaciens]
MRSLYAFFVSVPVVLALSGLSPAGAEERTWIFSGTELKQAIEGKLAPEVSDPEMRRLVSVAKSSAYIAGVADLTSGSDWCGAAPWRPMNSPTGSTLISAIFLRKNWMNRQPLSCGRRSRSPFPVSRKVTSGTNHAR